MAFKNLTDSGICPENPESLLRDLRKKTIPGLLSHQADLIRSYLTVHTTQRDVALQLPTGSGKTLVGLLIGEWRRQKYKERVVYLCPTRQLVNQVAEQARTKYGLDVNAFTGSRADYHPSAAADWQNSETIGITTYSSLFNTNPFFTTPNLIILDDAHSAENYISSFWSMLIERNKPEHQAVFSALLGVIVPLLPPADRSRLSGNDNDVEDQMWVEKIPTPVFQQIVPETVTLLDEYTKISDLKHSWQVLRDSLHACHLYLSQRAILIRPLIPPTDTFTPFANAKQRIYMSATLGMGGDLERITGRAPIYRIPVPEGWDRQGIGRRFFIFPKRSLDDQATATFVMESIRLAGRALYLVPDNRSADDTATLIKNSIECKIFSANEIEKSKTPFVSCSNAVAVVANRYDGIDLVDHECRLLFMDGLPGGANLQERFFVLRVTAQLLLEERILTRLVQGFGRCTRSPNDYAAVVVLGENLNSYLFKQERRTFFHPEIQAELEFGLQQSKSVTAFNLLENLRHFRDQDAEWDGADKNIVTLRSGMKQNTLASSAELGTVVGAEIKYQYALWNCDFNAALEQCRAVIGGLTHPELRGYRALWLYLAGSAAWLANRAGHLDSDDVAKDYFRQAQAAAPVVRWIVGLHMTKDQPATVVQSADAHVAVLVERIEGILDKLGTVHDRKYDAEEAQILENILQNDDGVKFEDGHERLGRLLGYDAGNSKKEGAPDPWWIVDDSFCFVFEDHAEGGGDTIFSVKKARQAASHPDWIKEELKSKFGENVEIVPVLITSCTKTNRGAIPHLKKVKYWHLNSFREWTKNALQTIRAIRREFTGPGNLGWRTMAAQRIRSANIGPLELFAMLKQNAAEAMIEVVGKEEEADD